MGLGGNGGREELARENLELKASKYFLHHLQMVRILLYVANWSLKGKLSLSLLLLSFEEVFKHSIGMVGPVGPQG